MRRTTSSNRLARSLVALAAFGLAACAERQHALTYRLTVTVSDNGRQISGSTVRGEDWVPSQIGGDNVPLMHETRGDAIVLPVRGRLLVVTLAGWDKPQCTGPRDAQGCTRRGDWSPQAPKTETVGAREAWSWRAPAGPDGRASLAVGQLPVLVTFDGAPSLASVRVVDAAHLDAVFGPGVSVQAATVEATTGPVTRAAASALPFLAQSPSGMQSCWLADEPPKQLSPGEEVKNPDLGDCVWNSLFTE